MLDPNNLKNISQLMDEKKIYFDSSKGHITSWFTGNPVQVNYFAASFRAAGTDLNKFTHYDMDEKKIKDDNGIWHDIPKEFFN